MKPCIAILAHAGAANSVREFQPQWEKLGIPMIGFMPDGEAWPGSPVSKVVNIGISAHKGDDVFNRFLGICEWLLASDYDVFYIMEYDTLNMSDHLPSINGMAVNCAACFVTGLNAMNGQLLAFSPWVMTRPMLAALIEALKIQLKKRSCEEWVGGLLDRWIGVALTVEKVPVQNIEDALGWPAVTSDPHLYIRLKKPLVVHGWKRKEEFKDVWPQ
jgi:hypothetical protein